MQTNRIRSLALAALAAVSLGHAAQAQVATFTDLGINTPTAGPNDVSQLSTAGEIGSNAGINYYSDNTGQPGGTTFLTGANAAGYTVTNVIVATAPGGSGNDGTISASPTNNQPYQISFYALTALNTNGMYTNATLIAKYITPPGVATPGDFYQFSGLNVTLPPNTVCAFTWSRLSTGFGYMGIATVPPVSTTAPYPNGVECVISPNGGTNTVACAPQTLISGIERTNYSAVFDIGLTLNPSALPAYNVVPSFYTLPLPSVQYPGTTAHFLAQTNTAADTNGISAGAGVYWQGNNGSGWVTLANGLQTSGSTVSGATTTNLVIANIGAGDGMSYQCVFTNSVLGGPVNSASTPPVTLTVLPAPTAGSFAAAVLALNPVAFWPLNESSQNPANGTALAYDVAGGFTGTYGVAAEDGFNGIAGPESPALAGFPSVNYSWDGTAKVPFTYVTTQSSPSFATNVANQANSTNVTIVAWVYPTAGTESGSTGLVQLRSGADADTQVEGFGYGNTANQIGYVWNNNSSTTYNYASALNIPSNTWSMITLVISPTNSSLGVFNTNGAAISVQTVANRNEPWGQALHIGTDPSGIPAGGRSFIGQMSDVVIFSNSLSTINLTTLFQAAYPQAQFQPVIAPPATSTNVVVYAGASPKLSFAVTTLAGTASGYQWQVNTGSGWVNLANGLQASGSTISGASSISTSPGAAVTSAMSIAGIAAGDAGSYQLVVTNSPNGVILNTVASTTIAVTVLPAPAANSFAALAISYNPVAFWPLNENVDPEFGTAVAYDVAGGFNGLYGIASLNGFNGVAGPESPAYTGFPSVNYALQPTLNAVNTYVQTPASPTLPGNNTNVTLVAWVYPTGNQGNAAGLVFDRNNGTTTAGFDIGVGNQLGYTWDNNNSVTWSYNSGVVIPSNKWAMVACVVSPSNSTLYVGTTNGLFSVVQTIANINQTFGGGIAIGDDPLASATGARAFNGQIADAVMYATNLTTTQIGTLFAAGLALGKLPPIIGTQPTTTALYAGRTASFTVQASGLGLTTTYQWQVNTGSGWVNVVNGNGISGATTSALSVGNVSSANVGSYQVIVTSPLGSTTNTTPATLSVVPATGLPAYAQAVTNLNPVAYYRLGETGTNAFDLWGGFAGTYGLVGQGLTGSGPDSPTFPGFESLNEGASFTNSVDLEVDTGIIPDSSLNCAITVPPLNLNTNTVTMTAWVYPIQSPQVNQSGIFYDRSSGDNSGMNIFGTANALGYSWANQAATYNYNSGLTVPDSQWSFVAVVIQPTQATLYVYNTTSQLIAVNAVTNPVVSFAGVSQIGNDTYDASGNRTFNGYIDEVAIFNQVLTGNQIDQLFSAASGISVPAEIYAPLKAGNPLVNAGNTVTFTVGATNGSLVYSWYLGGILLTNGDNGFTGSLFSGAGSTGVSGGSALTISNFTSQIAGLLLQVSVFNTATPGQVVSSSVTTPGVIPTPAVWTADFCYTNATAFNGTASTGYHGGGVISAGTNWNYIKETGGSLAFAGPYTNVSSLDDSGSVNTGVNVTIPSGAGYVSATPIDSFLLDVYTQMPTAANGIVISTQPGFYNLALYGIDGAYSDRGIIFTVNGNSQTCEDGVLAAGNPVSDTAFVYGQNYVFFTNVLIGTGTLNIGTAPDPNAHGGGNAEADFNGFQLQLILPITLAIHQSGANMVVTYSGGQLLQADNVTGPWTIVTGVTSPYTTAPNSAEKFYKLQITSDPAAPTIPVD